MSEPPAGSWRESVRTNHDCRRTLLLRGRTRHFRALGHLREREEYGGRRQQQEIEVEVRIRKECTTNDEWIERELRHLGVAGEVSVLRMVAPALPESSKRQQRADEGAHVETEAEEAVLAEDL